MKNDVVKKIKDELDIVNTIQQSVTLSKKGQNFVGLCPFHSEKSPSFYVSPSKKMFHCFGCGASGDVLTFIMKHEHLSFKEVITQKALELNIDAPTFNREKVYHSAIDSIRETLSKLHQLFKETTSDTIITYCQKRGLSNASYLDFGLCEAPQVSIQQTWLHQEFIDENHAKKSGLFGADLYPLFHQRLIFPIHNTQGVIVGFSGRTLNKDVKAKYINSPESQVFSKKKLLYGFHLAKKDIRKESEAIIVEGFMDVILMHQYGFKHTVAVMGTALTDFHCKQLKQFCNTVTLLFDSDSAGQRAILSSIPQLQRHGLTINIATIPNAKDPADFLVASTSEEMRILLSKKQPYMNHFFHHKYPTINQKNSNDVSKFIQSLLTILTTETLPIIKENALKFISDQTNIAYSTLEQMMQPPASINQALREPLTVASKFDKAEQLATYFLTTSVACRNKFLTTAMPLLSIFNDTECQSLFEKSNETNYELIKKITHSEISQYLVSLVIKFSNIDYTSNEMEDVLNALLEKKINERINEIKQQLKDSSTDHKDLLLELSNLIKKRGNHDNNRT